MKLSILVPVFNEEKTIKNILEKINLLDLKTGKELVAKEVVVINDGSTDKTSEILKDNPNLYSILINNKKNFGKGYAVKEGLKLCSGDYVIIQDADNEYNPEEFKKFTKCIYLFKPDLIVGTRFIFDEYSRSHNFFNKIGNNFITFFFNIFYNTTFTDVYCCYICFKKELLNFEKISSFGFSQHAEILCSIVKNGKKFYEVPINYNGRTIQEGKKIRFYHIFSIFYQIIKSRFI
jgi:glycosyltransferase involved in cell wall biosynthesis